MKSQLDVLALSPDSPNAVINGTGLRVFYLLQHLAERHRISLVYWEGARSASASAPSFPQIRTFRCNPPSPPRRPLLTRLGDKLRIGKPYPALDEFTAVVRDQAASGRYDVVLAFHPITLAVAVAEAGVPVVADLIDEPALGAWRDFRVSSGPATRFRKARHVLQLVRYLRAHVPQVFAAAVVSEEDARSLRRIVKGVRVHVVPNGIDTAHFRPTGRRQEPDSVVFVGNFEGEPNHAGASFFAREVLPRLVRLRPAVRWYVVGANPTPTILALAANPNVEVVGWVDDVRPWLERGVVVSPLVSGGGIKNKVLEAWAMARPVVATPFGCAGLPAIHGRNIFIAETAGAFATMTAQLLEDRQLGSRLGDEGRRTVCRGFRWPGQADRIAALLTEAAEHGAAHRRNGAPPSAAPGA